MRTHLAVAMAALAAVGATQSPASFNGKAVPSASLKLAKGGTLSTQSMRGKVLVLDFWATWCAPCVAASPTMEKLYEKYKGRGLVVVGANITDTPAKVDAYVKEHHYTYPFALHNEALAQRLGVSAIPVFMFVDRMGVIRRVDTGFGGTSPAEWEATIKKLLG